MNFLKQLSCLCGFLCCVCLSEELVLLPEIEKPSPESPNNEEKTPKKTSKKDIKLLHPKKLPTVLENGQFIPSTVESFLVEETGLTSCSLVARFNLSHLIAAMGLPMPTLARGDADYLIGKGKKSGDLLTFKKNTILPKLTERYDTQGESVFDVYRFVAHRPKSLQTHRVVVFLGSDREWYILDPIDGEKSKKPQLLDTYLKNDVKAEWFVRIPGYSILNPISQEELGKSLPYLSDELQLYYHINYFDGRAVLQG